MIWALDKEEHRSGLKAATITSLATMVSDSDSSLGLETKLLERASALTFNGEIKTDKEQCPPSLSGV